jgi:hypothetical protein
MVSGPASRVLFDAMNDMSKAGLEIPTTSAFATYRENFCALNNGLPLELKQTDDQLTESYVLAIGRFGLRDRFDSEVTQFRLDNPTAAVDNPVKIRCI